MMASLKEDLVTVRKRYNTRSASAVTTKFGHYGRYETTLKVGLM